MRKQRIASLSDKSAEILTNTVESGSQSGKAEPPESIGGVAGLTHLPIVGACPGVYFLCRGEEVVYVGKSTRVMARVITHCDNETREFDTARVFFLPCEPEVLGYVERRFIAKLDPLYNGGAGKTRERLRRNRV